MCVCVRACPSMLNAVAQGHPFGWCVCVCVCVHICVSGVPLHGRPEARRFRVKQWSMMGNQSRDRLDRYRHGNRETNPPPTPCPARYRNVDKYVNFSFSLSLSIPLSLSFSSSLPSPSLSLCLSLYPSFSLILLFSPLSLSLFSSLFLACAK